MPPSRRLDGLYLVGVELGVSLNIWDVEEIPEEWAAFSRGAPEDPVPFLAEVDRTRQFAKTATFYQLLGVESTTSHADLKRHFYRLAGRFHPDHHMDHPEWTPSAVIAHGEFDCGVQNFVGPRNQKTLRLESCATIQRGTSQCSEASATLFE